MNHSEVIKKIREKINLSQQKFADYIKVKSNTINNIENGKSSITPEIAQQIINAFPELNLTVTNILSGEIFKCDIKQRALNLIDSLDKQPLKYKIPVLSNIYASAGNGCYTQSEDSTEYIEIDEIDVKALNLNVEQSDFIIARGDSMYPTIFDGDKILVDKSKNEIMDGKIYVIRRDDLIMVKRLQRLADGVKIISDNSTYDSYKLNMDDLKVCGRVLRVIKDV